MSFEENVKAILPFIFTYRDKVVVHNTIAEVVIRGHRRWIIVPMAPSRMRMRVASRVSSNLRVLSAGTTVVALVM